eukprot:PhF_6_TR40617/c0_g1_i3/m.60938
MLVASLPLEYSHRHFVVTQMEGTNGGEPRRWLVDTGSPGTFTATSTPGPLHLSATLSYPPIPQPSIVQMVQSHVDPTLYGILGMNVLSQYDLEFDFNVGVLNFYQSGTYQVTAESAAVAKTSVTFVMGVPVVPLEYVTYGVTLPTVVDTGAFYTYVHRTALYTDDTQPPQSQQPEPDFHPFFGSFKPTLVGESDIKFGHGGVFGHVPLLHLPLNMEQALIMPALYKAIVQNDVLLSGPQKKFILLPSRNEMVLL